MTLDATWSHGRKSTIFNPSTEFTALILVEGQPIEFIIDTGSPVSIITTIIKPKNMKTTPKSYVDVKKNPMNFKGKAMVEVKTERNSDTADTNHGKRKYSTLTGIKLVGQTRNWPAGEQENKHHPEHRFQRKR